jgi:hypothetical protein
MVKGNKEAGMLKRNPIKKNNKKHMLNESS